MPTILIRRVPRWNEEEKLPAWASVGPEHSGFDRDGWLLAEHEARGSSPAKS